MACKCLENSKEKILGKIAEMHPDRTVTEADFDNRILSLDGEQSIILTHKFEYTYTFIKTNGTVSMPKNTSIGVNPTYCGFCGKKFIED